ncbi:unnamed protein product [Paramecium pentaurelia]|uniref:Uncharacterized protein n=1 Tax=Paramecium pentaurelia TaxID=43138 RepID=A0A8S1W3J8_9CILI|nr:unnamed protein product [Paramecium pentaurelia]
MKMYDIYLNFFTLLQIKSSNYLLQKKIKFYFRATYNHFFLEKILQKKNYWRRSHCMLKQVEIKLQEFKCKRKYKKGHYIYNFPGQIYEIYQPSSHILQYADFEYLSQVECNNTTISEISNQVIFGQIKNFIFPKTSSLIHFYWLVGLELKIYIKLIISLHINFLKQAKKLNLNNSQILTVLQFNYPLKYLQILIKQYQLLQLSIYYFRFYQYRKCTQFLSFKKVVYKEIRKKINIMFLVLIFYDN